MNALSSFRPCVDVVIDNTSIRKPESSGSRSSLSALDLRLALRFEAATVAGNVRSSPYNAHPSGFPSTTRIRPSLNLRCQHAPKLQHTPLLRPLFGRQIDVVCWLSGPRASSSA